MFLQCIVKLSFSINFRTRVIEDPDSLKSWIPGSDNFRLFFTASFIPRTAFDLNFLKKTNHKHLLISLNAYIRTPKKCKMLKKFFSIIAASTILCCYSCKKDDQPSGSLTGNWKFISLHAQTESTAQYNDGTDDMMSVTKADYTSTNNAGSVSFTSNTMASNGVSYDISTAATLYEYMNGVFFDSTSTPLYVNIPPTNSSGTYRIIGEDSIAFTNSFAVGAQTSTGASASGGRFAIDGNILTITSHIVQDTVLNYGGYFINDHQIATASVTLERQ